MKTLKAAARLLVIAFVFVAGHLTFAGLDPNAKADAGSIFNETEQAVQEKSAQEKNLATSKKKAVAIDTETAG